MARRAALLLALGATTTALMPLPPVRYGSHRPTALVLADASSRATVMRLVQRPASPRRRRARRRRTGPEIETMVVKTLAVAVAGGAIRSFPLSVLPRAFLTLGAVLAVRAMRTEAVEGLLLALVLTLTGLGNYFPFNFVVFGVGGAGFFSIVYDCVVHVERWQRRRRARRSKQAGDDDEPVLRSLNESGTEGEEAQEPVGLIVGVVGVLLYTVLGAVPQLGGALLG